MKHMKKLIAMALAVMMVLSLATAVSADETTAHTITINNSTEGYTYVAYQIFQGTLVDGELTNIDWGENISNSAGLLTALQGTTVFADCETVVDVATKLSENTDKDNDVAKAFAAIVADYLTTEVAGTSTYADGKYTIPVTGDGYYLVLNTQVPENAAYTRYILEVVGDVSVTHKGTVPTVDKEIVGGTTTETGDYSIKDTVDYKLTGTLPSNYADYEAYVYTFHDTLTAGLDLIAEFDETNATKVVSGVTVKVGDTDITSYFTITYENRKLTVSCADLTEIADITADSKIVVEYSCTLNEDAVVGGKGNPNTVYLEFSNDPNYDGEGTPTTGETPEDTVVVFTYELDVTKVDGVDNTIMLEGAEFKLQNAEGKWVTVDADGKVTDWVDTQDAGSVLTSDADGNFKIIGLEDGEYNLVETKAPAGYNLLSAPVVITITSTYDETGVKTLTITVGDKTVDGNTTTGVVETTVENNSGAVLPSTGGMGTTLFYIVGGILVLAAVVLLVTKRRMANAE